MDYPKFADIADEEGFPEIALMYRNIAIAEKGHEERYRAFIQNIAVSSTHLEATPFARWKFFTSLDVFSFPWWKYRISKPSKGVDAMFQVTYTLRKSLSMYFNYRYKQKERDVTGTSGTVIEPIYHHKLRYRLT